MTPDADGPEWAPHVTYEFFVNGVSYSGDTIRIGDMSYMPEKKARSVADRYPQGAHIQISYNPKRPRESVIQAGVSWDSVLHLVFGLGFLIMALCMAWEKFNEI